MATSSKRVKARIYGDEYTIVGEADSDYIQSLAQDIDARMKEIAKEAPGMAKSKIAVLVALNLADELKQKLAVSGDVGDSSLAERTKKVISLLEEGIIGEV